VSIAGVVIKEDSDDLPYAIGMRQKSITIIIVKDEYSCVTIVTLLFLKMIAVHERERPLYEYT